MGPFESRALLRTLFDAAISAVDPVEVMPHYLEAIQCKYHRPGTKRVIVLGAGKAAARMALSVERNWAGPVSGLVVTRFGHSESLRQIEVVEASHPMPDSTGVDAAKRILSIAHSLGEDDLVLVLVSGGGSALLTLPAQGISLADKREVNRALLVSGAAIGEMNRVRRHLSAIKGGKLGAACGAATVVTLIISDVPNDDATVVASSPTLSDHSTPQDAVAILNRYKIPINEAVSAHLNSASPPTTALRGPREHHIIATAQDALNAAAECARQAGIYPLVLGGSIEGESRDVAAVHAGIAAQIHRHAQPVSRPCVIISGGETTVTVRGDGRGGRNAEFLLSLLQATANVPNLYALACDTDGIDGMEDNAGAVIDPTSLERAQSVNLCAREHLDRNDAYSYFEALNDLMITGPTRTNVNDFRAILLP
jgi:glycerate 2-kinase